MYRSIARPSIFRPLSFTTYSPEYRPAPCTRIREPNGRTAGSAAQIPSRVCAPDAVFPGVVYAVAVNCIRVGLGDGAGAAACGGGTLATSRGPRAQPPMPITTANNADVTRARRIVFSRARAVPLDQVEAAVVIDRHLENRRDAELRRLL